MCFIHLPLGFLSMRKEPLRFLLDLCLWARTNFKFYLLTFLELCPQSPPFWRPYTPLPLWLHTYFHGFFFLIKQKPCTSSSGQPVSEVLWNVTQTPWEHRKGRFPDPVPSMVLKYTNAFLFSEIYPWPFF